MNSGTESLQNCYLQLEIDAGSITVLRGRFADTAEFSQNLLSARPSIGWGLVERPTPEALSSVGGAFRSNTVTRTAESLLWQADWFAAGDDSATFSAEWRIALPLWVETSSGTETHAISSSFLDNVHNE